MIVTDNFFFGVQKKEDDGQSINQDEEVDPAGSKTVSLVLDRIWTRPNRSNLKSPKETRSIGE
jgi:hypothetical protein